MGFYRELERIVEEGRKEEEKEGVPPLSSFIPSLFFYLLLTDMTAFLTMSTGMMHTASRIATT